MIVHKKSVFFSSANKILLLILDRVKEGGDHDSIGKPPPSQGRVSFPTLFWIGKLNKDLWRYMEKETNN